MTAREIASLMDQHSYPGRAQAAEEDVQQKDQALLSTLTADHKKTHVNLFKAKYGSSGSGLDAGLGSAPGSNGASRGDQRDGTPRTPAQTAPHCGKGEHTVDSLGGISGPKAAKEAPLRSVLLRSASPLPRPAPEVPAKARVRTPVPQNLGGSRLDPILRGDIPFPRCDGVLRSGSPYPRPSLLESKAPARRRTFSLSREPSDVSVRPTTAAGVSRTSSSSSCSSILAPSYEDPAEEVNKVIQWLKESEASVPGRKDEREKLERLRRQVERLWQLRYQHHQPQTGSRRSPGSVTVRSSSVENASPASPSYSAQQAEPASAACGHTDQRPLVSTNANDLDYVVLGVLFMLFLLFLFANNLVSLFSHKDSGSSSRDYGIL